MLLKLVLRDNSVTAVVKSLLYYRETSISSYNVSFQEASVSHVARDLISAGKAQGVVKSSYSRYVRVTTTVVRFYNTSRLVETLNIEVTSGGSSVMKGAGLTSNLGIKVF